MYRPSIKSTPAPGVPKEGETPMQAPIDLTLMVEALADSASTDLGYPASLVLDAVDRVRNIDPDAADTFLGALESVAREYLDGDGSVVLNPTLVTVAAAMSERRQDS